VTETCVYRAIEDLLAPLVAYGFTFANSRNGVFASVQGVCRTFAACELIGADDPCGYIAEVFGL
jgi:hypothetical protein